MSKTTEKPDTITDMRADLRTVFREIRAKKTPPVIAKALNDTANRIMGTCYVQLRYAALREVKPNIPFIE